MKQTTVFDFSSYNIDKTASVIAFNYALNFEDNSKIDFTEKLTLPVGAEWDKIPANLLSSILEALHLILGISYWKTYCPKEIVLKSFSLTQKQAEFWNTVYTKGLGEFFYRNSIDFRNLVNFPSVPGDKRATPTERKNRSLLPFGGGKDSIVTSELLKKEGKEFTIFTLGTSNIQEEVSRILGKKALVVKRQIDPQLFELNLKKEVYNGHVPISAIYHLVGLLVALLFDYRYLVFPNEASANYGNVNYLGEEINHQWSKSFEFEKLVQNYIQQFITSDVTAFSLMRPLNEIKIVELFSQLKKYFPVFSSCNRNFTLTEEKMSQKWCGECPKCSFVFLMLSAFLPKKEVVGIFGKNLLNDDSLMETYKELLGRREIKPWDCVGTPEEVQLAFYLSHQKGEYENDSVMQMFVSDVLPTLENPNSLKEKLLSVNADNSVPEEFVPIIESLT